MDTPLYRWRWVALIVILAAEVMDMLDTLITNVAAPSIRADLGGSPGTVQWLAAGYTLAMAIGLITGGRLGDLYGRRRMFLLGAAGFTLASLLCGVAMTPGTLVGARVLQGLCGALMLPQGIGLIKQMFPPKEMAAAFGLFGPIMGLASVGGPVLAGWLTDADLFGLGWRMIFLINLPLGAAAVLAGLKFLPEGRAEGAQRLDLGGAVLASAGAALLIYPLVQGRELDWPLWTFAMMASALAVFGLFAWYELRRHRSGRDPLVVPALVRKRAFSGGLLMGLAFFCGLAGFGLVFALYLQLGLGYPPLKAGLAQIPWSVGIIIGFGVAQAIQRLGRTVIHIGAVIMAAGIAGMILTLEITGIEVTPWQLTPALIGTGIGMGLLMAPFFDIVLSGVESAEAGSAGGTLTAVQQLGAALGAALLGTIFFGALGGQTGAAAGAAVPELRQRLTAAGVVAPAQDRLVSALDGCARDRAAADDPAAVPASCVLLEKEAAAAIASVPAASGAGVREALETTGSDAAAAGFGAAMKITLWVEIGLLGLTFVLAFLLPRHARPEEAHAERSPAEPLPTVV